MQLKCREAETVILRLRVLRAKLLEDTYSEECLTALQHARDALTKCMHTEATQLRQVRVFLTTDCWSSMLTTVQARTKLRAYQEAGPALAGLATRYRALCQEVQHAQYSLVEVLGSLHAELKSA